MDFIPHFSHLLVISIIIISRIITSFIIIVHIIIAVIIIITTIFIIMLSSLLSSFYICAWSYDFIQLFLSSFYILSLSFSLFYIPWFLNYLLTIWTFLCLILCSPSIASVFFLTCSSLSPASLSFLLSFSTYCTFYHSKQSQVASNSTLWTNAIKSNCCMPFE